MLPSAPDNVRPLKKHAEEPHREGPSEHATPLGWAEYAETLPEAATRGKQYTEIGAYLREKGGAGV